ncbi:MAG: FecR domain-containing protein [Fibrobacter sp.]|uniref:FecR family protein n=1 Tax=Fibrobacter sp. TaxID=35828 RepID=UPI0025C53A73|nr:FecR family protein [Fibrobacter sp.]MBQ9225138.1 FecR domain-containing protein [Fibrobacter sp.]
MSFSGKIKASMVLLLAVSSVAFAAKGTSGKVIDKLGDAKLQKSTKIGVWDEINVGNRVREKDQIRTGIESHVAITLSDGSSIVVQENSLVEFTTLQAEDGIQTALTDIKTGKVRFDAQKQHSGGSFKFKTATATAAIRGTDGTFGKTIKDKATYLSLGRGNAILRHNTTGQECEVNGGQTAIFRGEKGSCLVLDIKNSGNKELVNALDTLLDNETITEEKLKETLGKLDADLQERISKAFESISCKFEPLEDTITVNKVSTKATCPEGVQLSISGATLKNNNNTYDITLDWKANANGPKKFNATCTGSLEVPCKQQKGKKGKQPLCKKEVSFECGTLTTFYKNPADTVKADTAKTDSAAVDSSSAKKFAVTTPSPVTVCEPGSVTIEGTFDQTDPKGTLYVKMGKYKSRNLVPLSANGEFTHTINISDMAGNWNETKVTVEYSGASGNHKATVLLNVNKTCKQVNMKRPALTFASTSPIRCDARFALAEATDDIVIVSKEIDGNAYGETTYRQNSNLAIKLTPGIHKYTLKATDQAGNSTQISRKLGCFPPHSATIEVVGGTYEYVPAPPPPPKTPDEIRKTMRFRLIGVLQQDPAHIKHIRVTHENKTLLDLTGDQITELDYDVPVTLSRGTTPTIKIYVEMMNGKKYNSGKTYKVN